MSLASSFHGRHPPPEPGSIRAILLQNCTTRLFVHPLEWTANHLPALGVDLVISACLGEPVMKDVKCQVDESIQVLGAVWEIENARRISNEHMRQLIRRTGELQKLDIMDSTLFFQYENYHIAQLPPLILAWHRSTSMESSRTPIWAYTDHKWISAARRKRHTSRKRSWTFATKDIKSKQKLVIDPVYVAILITLAQLRRRGLQGTRSHRHHQPQMPKGDRLSKRVNSNIVQYTADIPCTYLQKFDEPYKFYEGSLCIEKRTLPSNEPARILQAMKTAFCDSGCSKSSSPASTSKRKAFGELNLNMRDQKPESKRSKVCNT